MVTVTQSNRSVFYEHHRAVVILVNETCFVELSIGNILAKVRVPRADRIKHAPIRIPVHSFSRVVLVSDIAFLQDAARYGGRLVRPSTLTTVTFENQMIV